MNTATDNLKTWNPTKVKATPEWRTEFEKSFKDPKLSANSWKAACTKAKKELDAEQKTADGDLKEYEKLLSAFHADTKDRLGKVMLTVTALGKNDPATDMPALFVQAKTICKQLILDLDKPFDEILSKSAAALQGNRADLMTDADIDKAAKINPAVPVADLKKLLKEYKEGRMDFIAASNEITRTHTNKIKTHRDRALDALKMIEKLEGMVDKKRDEIKADLKTKIKECMDFFSSPEIGNFLKPQNQLLQLKNLAETVKDAKSKQEASDAIDKAGGKDRVATYLILASKQYNDWKIQEKKIDLLDVYCQKVKNDTATAEMKKLKSFAEANKKAGKAFKDQAEAIAKAWADTAALRAK